MTKRLWIGLGLLTVLLAGCAATVGVGNKTVGGVASNEQSERFVSTMAPKAMVFVAEEPPSIVEQKVASMSRPQVLTYLYELSQRDTSVLQPSRQEKTVVYAVFGRVDPGTILTTKWNVNRSSMPKPYEESYNYRISSSTPQSPIVILNGLYNENPGTFEFEISINGNDIGSSTKRYIRGLN